MRSILPRTAIPVDWKEASIALRGWLTETGSPSEDVTKFEKEFASYLGVAKTYACNSGRTALHTSLQALNLEPADEVIVPAYVCAIVFEVILRLKLKPVLVDVDQQTFNINPELIPKAVTDKTKAIVPVHLFGRPCEMDKIVEIAEEHGLYVIEDAAQALGAEYKAGKVGTFGDFAIFSFGPGKSITSGEGGAIAVNNSELLTKVESIRINLASSSAGWSMHLVRNVFGMKMFANPFLYGFVRERLEKEFDQREAKTLENCKKLAQDENARYLHSTVKLAKMPAFSARIARTQLQKIDDFNDKRIANANALTTLLSETNDSLLLPQTQKQAKNVFTRYPVRILKGSRDTSREKMLARGVDSERPYDYLADYLTYNKSATPNAVALAITTLTIPNHPLLKPRDIHKTANALKAALNKV